MSAGPDPGGAAHPERADDFLAPLLFALVARVRREAERVAARSGGSRGAEEWDPEAIHDLRVAVRRLRTMLRPARRLFGKNRIGAVEEELRRYARATGALRDEEVLRETLGELDLGPRAREGLGVWLVQRARQERARRREVATLVAARDEEAAGGPPLLEVLAHLERALGRRGKHATGAREMAEACLAEAARDVSSRLGLPPSEGAEMHALRIRYKRLRYSAEAFAPLVGERALAVAKEAARMQKHLGALHDVEEALRRVRRARSLPHATRAALQRALMRKREERREHVGRELEAERHVWAAGQHD